MKVKELIKILKDVGMWVLIISAVFGFPRLFYVLFAFVVPQILGDESQTCEIIAIGGALALLLMNIFGLIEFIVKEKDVAQR